MSASEPDTPIEREPRPACPAGDRGDREWRRDRATGGLLAFYRPCKSCFEGEVPGGEQVVRSQAREGKVLHRPEYPEASTNS